MAGRGGPAKSDEPQPHPPKDQLPNISYCITVLLHGMGGGNKIECIRNNAVMELMRGLRNQLNELITGLSLQDMAPMSLGLSEQHADGRYHDCPGHWST